MPAVVINKVGRGKAVYLNFLTNYSNLRDLPLRGGDNMRMVIQDILRTEKMEAKLRIVELKNNRGLPYTQCTFFQKGQHLYLGILTSPEIVKGVSVSTPAEMTAYSRHVRIELPGTYCVYNIREHRYSGLTGSIETDIIPGVALLYGLMPARIRALDLAVNKAVFMPGEAVVLDLAVAPRDDYIVRVECFGPEDNCLEYFSRNVEVKGGQASITLPLALDEQPGVYRVRAREIISGKEKDVSFRVTDHEAE